MNYNLELDRIIAEIKENGHKTVLIQLPDGLKPKAKEIVDKIIPNYGKEFRYIMGVDAKSLIDSICDYKDNIEEMDKEINDIMSRYTR